MQQWGESRACPVTTAMKLLCTPLRKAHPTENCWKTNPFTTNLMLRARDFHQI